MEQKSFIWKTESMRIVPIKELMIHTTEGPPESRQVMWVPFSKFHHLFGYNYTYIECEETPISRDGSHYTFTSRRDPIFNVVGFIKSSGFTIEVRHNEAHTPYFFGFLETREKVSTSLSAYCAYLVYKYEVDRLVNGVPKIIGVSPLDKGEKVYWKTVNSHDPKIIKANIAEMKLQGLDIINMSELRHLIL
jgi:hypothetical protein